ncbi:Rieske 2Fe-2S domain-containing protein [Rhodococcus sp. IEGM1428]|uniref:Rieske 2Fe-2S domain-containing protein n=1 Tax=Rhodococcus sp. IEGM1428 TaxID=3392191 RepID=UPI003D0BB098
MTTAHEDDIRIIEADALPTRFARGWHCLGTLKEFSDDKPHTINAFGKKLVVFRGESGTISILDAYCRHMGGDLSSGEIKGDEIACPFHDWRWGGDGRCKQVPYSKRVPLRARTTAWTTLEQDGLLFVWHDPEGNPPSEQEAIPTVPGIATDAWTDWVWYSTTMNVNCREIIDNNVDMAHFFYVHGTLPTYFKNVFEGSTTTQYFNSGAREDIPGPEGQPPLRGVTSVATYYGPAFMINTLTYHYDEADTNIVLAHCHYPIDENNTVYHYGISIELSDALPAEYALPAAKATGDHIAIGIDQDVVIWKNKARIDNPLLCEEDGAVYQLRRWYQQFYVDRADVVPDMVNRFEHELDTTQPLKHWNEEIRRNVENRVVPTYRTS